MYESRTYDDGIGRPVVVLVVTGEHDVSRLVHTLNGAPPVMELLSAGETIVRQLKRHSTGRDALKLLAQHGGRDFTEPDNDADTQACPLNPTELALLDRLAEGDTRAKAARRIGLSPNSTHMTVHRMLTKTCTENAAHLAATALRNGWIT